MFPSSIWSLDRELCHVVARAIIKQDLSKTLENAFFFFIDIKLQLRIEVTLDDDDDDELFLWYGWPKKGV